MKKLKVNYIIDDFQDVIEYIFSVNTYFYSSVFHNEEIPGVISNGTLDDDLFLITDIFLI